MNRLLAIAALLLLATAVQAADVATACLSRGDTLYRVRTAGEQPATCRLLNRRTGEREPRVQLLVAEPGTTYTHATTASGLPWPGEVLASLPGLTIRLLAEYVTCDMVAEFDGEVTDLKTGETGLLSAAAGILVNISTDQAARRVPDERAWMLLDGTSYRLSDAMVRWLKDGTCKGSLTILHVAD